VSRRKEKERKKKWIKGEKRKKAATIYIDSLHLVISPIVWLDEK
jgi:hypothetical protein